MFEILFSVKTNNENRTSAYFQTKTRFISVSIHFFFFSGIQDPSSVKPISTLADLGMDSLMGVDIKQTIERSFGLSLSNTQIQQLKFSELEKVGAK